MSTITVKTLEIELNALKKEILKIMNDQQKISDLNSDVESKDFEKLNADDRYDMYFDDVVLGINIV